MTTLHKNRLAIFPKFDWIQEEETLLQFIESDAFNLQPLEKITVTLIYLDENQEIIQATTNSLKFTNDCSMIEWTTFKQYIDSNATCDGQTYTFLEACLYHNATNYENLDSFSPSLKTIKLEKGQNIKLPPTIFVLHDSSHIFVLLKKNIATIKSILKTGEKSSKTKKVRICDGQPVFIRYSSRKTKRTLH
jgi:hypothetical protein